MTHPIAKALCLAGALSGGGAFSQYPEFAQQYTQRLAGQVDALALVVADFDRSALAAGLTRTQALGQMTGTDFLKARQSDMTATFQRHSALSATLMALRTSDGLDRLRLIHRLNDAQTLRNTWDDFQPALPITRTGAVMTGIGTFVGWFTGLGLLGLLKRLGKPFRKPLAQRTRHDPPIQRPAPYTTQTPRLMGETRP